MHINDILDKVFHWHSAKRRPAGGFVGDAFQNAFGQFFDSYGGLRGLMKRFHERGFGEHFESWRGGGDKSISPEDIHHVFGDQEIQAIADHFNVRPDDVPRILAEHLPAVIGEVNAAGKVGSHA